LKKLLVTLIEVFALKGGNNFIEKPII